MPYQEFGTPRQRQTEPVRFKLVDQEFEALPEAPAGAVNDLLAGITLDERGNRVYSAPNLIRFVTSVLVDERCIPIEDDDDNDYGDRVVSVDDARERGMWVDPDWHASKVAVMPADDVERFLDLCFSKRTVVPVDTLGEVVIWLSEKLTGRPMVPPGRSSPGRR